MDRLINIYCSLIRPFMEYAWQVWHGGLTGGQSDLLEYELFTLSCQKSAMGSHWRYLSCLGLIKGDRIYVKNCSMRCRARLIDLTVYYHLLKLEIIPNLKIGRTKKSFVNRCLFNLL